MSVNPYIRELDQLVGGTITGTLIDQDDEFFGLQVMVNRRKWNLWLQSDDEGNGPGAFSLEPQDEE